MISGTSFGLEIAMIIFPVMCSISLLPMTSQADFMASVAATLTCFFVSHMHAVTSGTTSGRASPSCLGAVLLKVEIHVKARVRLGHFFSTSRAAKIVGKRLFMAKGVILVQIESAASLASLETSGLLAFACSIHPARHSLLKHCAAGAPSATALTVVNAAIATASVVETHFPARALMLEANPDFSTPSALIAATMDVSSPRVRPAIFASSDMSISM
mmetsp:Transcript_32542/g.38918  ORF Transcript_32542/g.38918 Transcript_32542/m.38918 type:complete len:216 (+) Transcript_32542:2617-3264(+)